MFLVPQFKRYAAVKAVVMPLVFALDQAPLPPGPISPNVIVPLPAFIVMLALVVALLFSKQPKPAVVPPENAAATWARAG